MRFLNKMNKKAVFFTLLVISILSLFLVSYTIYSVAEDRESINKRIKTMNNFVFSMDKDISRKLYISGFRIIFLFNKKIVETGNYITNLNATFEEVFFNATFYGETDEDIQTLMEKSTFSGIQDSINENAKSINININMSNPNLSVSQEDPWNIKVSLKTDLLIEDKGRLALWNRTVVFNSYIPIKNFDDPLYILNTNGLVINKVNRTIYEPFVQGNEISNLKKHAENHLYTNSTSAPSFLDRLEGKTTANENGIESLVYLPDLSAQGISVRDKSVVDYVYFSDNNPVSCNIQGTPSMPSWFKLHNPGFYGATCQ